MRQAITKATPAISVPVTDPLTEDKLQALYSLRWVRLLWSELKRADQAARTRVSR
jgi:hypothetical protein